MLSKSFDLKHLTEKSLSTVTAKLGGGVIQERVTGLLRGVAMIVAYHKAPEVVIESLLGQLSVFLNVESESQFLKRAKYVLVCPMAAYLRNAAPEAEHRIVYQGAWKRWMKSRLNAYNKRNTHLWFSFMQCKRSCLPLSESIVHETYLKHRAQMERTDPLQDKDEVLNIVMSRLEPMLAKIAAKLTRVSDDTLQALEHKASQNAAWEASRARGGQASYLAERLKESAFEASSSDGVRFAPKVEDLRCMREVPVSLTNSERVVRASDTAIRGSGQDVVHGSTQSEYFDSVLHAEWSRRLRQWALDDTNSYGGRLPAMIQAVLEPLKVRVISKGPSAPYFYSKGLQRALHTIMREMPCFRLIGRPVSPTDLMDIAIKGTTHKWFSGDYEASTDNLSARLGAAILERLIVDLDDWDADIYRAVLKPHACHYPHIEGQPDILPVNQQNGQLMGSVLSFPVLCLANLGLYLTTVLTATPTVEEIWSATDKVLVNGDDILYCATEEQFELHAVLGASIGLKMSVGKTYLHSSYANVNSTSFEFDLRSEKSTPTQVNFLNSGLYFGQHKVLGESGRDIARVGVDLEDPEVADAPLCAVVGALMSGALPGRQRELLSSFITQHGSELMEETKGRNLFIAKSLGGMGIERPAGFTTVFTPLQRSIAAMLYCLANPVFRVVKQSPYRWKAARAPVLKVAAWEYIFSEMKAYRMPYQARSRRARAKLAKLRDLSESVMEQGFVMLTAGPTKQLPGLVESIYE